MNSWGPQPSTLAPHKLESDPNFLLAYVLIERLRALALQGTALATAQVDTLRIKLLKVAAAITRNTRRVCLDFAANWPSADIFAHAVNQLRSP